MEALVSRRAFKIMMQEPKASDVNSARNVRWLFAAIAAATFLLAALLIWFGSNDGRPAARATSTPVPAKESASDKQLREAGEEIGLEGVLLAPSAPPQNP
jgi:hypothetical protein